MKSSNKEKKFFEKTVDVGLCLLYASVMEHNNEVKLLGITAAELPQDDSTVIEHLNKIAIEKLALHDASKGACPSCTLTNNVFGTRSMKDFCAIVVANVVADSDLTLMTTLMADLFIIAYSMGKNAKSASQEISELEKMLGLE